MKKILSMILALSLMLLTVQPTFAKTFYDSGNKAVTVNDVKGISHTFGSEVNAVKSKSEFNYTLDAVNLEFNGRNARIQATINGKAIEFTPTLHQSQLGYNASNTPFGISSDISEGFRLTKFTIEEDAKSFSLMEPNADMAGNTVVSLAFYKPSTKLKFATD